MVLRPYQKDAVDAVTTWIQNSVSPCMVEAPTGSGKSHIIAEVSKRIHKISGGRHILCLAPSAELVEQNYSKYTATGNFASMYSASVGEKSLAAPVVFGTPLTVLNNIDKFTGRICLVQLDECHEITPTIQEIINSIKDQNPLLRVVGYSATPYRTGTGFIYATDEKGVPVAANVAYKPYFAAKVYTISARELIEEGYLTPPFISALGEGVERYNTIHMKVGRNGTFLKSDIEKAYPGQGRKTSKIIQDIVYQAQKRNGVLIFASTVQHAKECLASLPPQISAIVTGKTPKTLRKKILDDFKAQKIKYIVNVSVLTRGFDAPHVDVIALLRATESSVLLQQIVGRGLRLHPGKKECMILDYAENIDRHCPDGDIFAPEIRVHNNKKDMQTVTAVCPVCKTPNIFSLRKSDAGYGIDEYGYFIDLAGDRIPTDYGDMPAHYGRRCMGLYKSGFEHVRCLYRWTSKKCPKCNEDNDIAAKYCTECKAEIVDPNEKLRIEFKEYKKDPYKLQTDEVISLTYITTISQSGNECIRVSCITKYRTFDYWVFPNSTNQWLHLQYRAFCQAIKNTQKQPETITYIKNIKTGFFEVKGYNRPVGKEPEEYRGGS